MMGTGGGDNTGSGEAEIGGGRQRSCLGGAVQVPGIRSRD